MTETKLTLEQALEQGKLEEYMANITETNSDSVKAPKEEKKKPLKNNEVIFDNLVREKEDVNYVIYNPESLDSLAATALYVCSLEDDTPIIYQTYHPLGNNNFITHYDKLVIMGVELEKETFLRLTKDKKAQVFCYRDSYKQIIQDDNYSAGLTFHHPVTDWYGEEQAIVDNSVANVVNQWLHSVGKPSKLAIIRNQIRDIGFYTNMGRVEGDNHKSLTKLFNLKNLLEHALYGRLALSALKDLRELEGESGYLAYYNKVKQLTVRGAEEVTLSLKPKKKFSDYEVYSIPLVSCPENMSRDVMRVLVPSKKRAMTFEQVKDKKIYRIFTENRYLSEKLTHSLNPIRYWFEGEILVAIS